MTHTQEKFVTYEEIQANPMLQWFFEGFSNDEIKRTAEDKFFKEWQEYVKNEDMERVYFLEPLKGKDPREAILDETAYCFTMAQFLFFRQFSYEYYEFILQFIHDKKYLNILLYDLYGCKMELEDIKKLCLLLVDKGANLNASFYHTLTHSCWYQTLLHRYCSFVLNNTKQGREKQLEIVQFLLELGADPNIKDSEGENMLHKAIGNEEQKLANLIIQSGKIKDMNARIDKYKDATYYDDTALNIAVSSLYSSTVKLLLEAGADASAINRLGKTPLDTCGDQSATIEKYIRKAGGKSLLEILGSEEKVKEYREAKKKEWKIEREKGEEYEQKLWEDYKKALEKTTSLAFLIWIEVERD
ncbi:ankyrin repeat domain-containing protein [Helicobacter typhlonius]|uniref:ankyrin repeat domain-containing protein n=1 Tax=Helicobacter typhlonius TaxID=76936 RepID=UPI002FE26C84